jgi:hypothetical protein
MASYEGCDIVGLWLVMQFMIGLFDLGMGSTLSREFSDQIAKSFIYNYLQEDRSHGCDLRGVRASVHFAIG